ncbi:alpha/beta hydrolase [Shimia biformata]|uniref:alpha/beta hydrolase n=1 Tax=Shimia biformata TaxID=1294299 RepID=UPI0019510103|nr:alpha/beta fold hydrolase [Shimia biformata]
MRTIGRFLGRLLVVLIVVGLALWAFGPYERISTTPTFAAQDIGEDIDSYLAARESGFGEMTDGVQKRVIWHGDAGERTPVAVVYVHGFSATSEEIRPVPDRVAEALGANLYYTRLTGHGLPGAALAEATVQDWMNDVAEAIEIGRRIGDRVLVISTSTGGTLVAEAALQPDLVRDVAGMAFISPNFGINDPMAPVLTLPAARWWVPLVAGAERSWQAGNAEHEKYWTTRYPTVAVMQMAALVQDAVGLDFGQATVPAYFRFSRADRVVREDMTQTVADHWGAPVVIDIVSPGPDDDPDQHVITGDIRSPGETDDTIQDILSWFNGL